MIDPHKCRLKILCSPILPDFTFPVILQYSQLLYTSNQLHLGVGVNGDDIIALWRLDACLSVGLTVQIVLDEEIAFLLEVGAAVIANKAVRVVELVPGLHDGATVEGDEGRKLLDLESL